MALKFLNKKGWHTGSLRNIENVWKAEEKHKAEQRKLEELQKQMREENERLEFRKLQEKAGLVSKQERLDFMYESGLGVGKPTSEEYLLGKPVEETKEENALDKLQAKPGSLFVEEKISANDAWRKIRSDPLLQIRQQELEARKRVLNNPVKMEMLRKQAMQKKEEKKRLKAEKKQKRKELKKMKRKMSEASSRRESDDSSSSDSDMERSKRRRYAEDDRASDKQRDDGSRNRDVDRMDDRGRDSEKRGNTSRDEDSNRSDDRRSSFDRTSERRDGYKRDLDRRDDDYRRDSDRRDYRRRDSDRRNEHDRRREVSDASPEGRKDRGEEMGREDARLSPGRGNRGEDRGNRGEDRSNRGDDRGPRPQDRDPGRDGSERNRRLGKPPLPRKRQLTEEEREARLREMQEDAEQHEEKRWQRLKRASMEEEKQAKEDAVKLSTNFLDKTARSVYGTDNASASVADTLHRRAHYREKFTDTNAFKR